MQQPLNIKKIKFILVNKKDIKTLKVFKLCFGLAQLCALCAPISFCAFYCNEGKKKEIWMTFQISVSKA